MYIVSKRQQNWGLKPLNPLATVSMGIDIEHSRLGLHKGFRGPRLDQTSPLTMELELAIIISSKHGQCFPDF
jgi:hypothetical protein